MSANETGTTPIIVAKRRKIFTHFIGVDVSKDKLDYAVLNQEKLLFHEVRPNTKEDIGLFLARLKKIPGFTLPKALFCMEASGIYGNHLIEAVRKSKAAMVVDNPVHIKRSMGLVRGKEDKVDAIRIARYCRSHKDEVRLWTARRAEVTRLTALFALRNRLLSLSIAISNPLMEEQRFVKKNYHDRNKELCSSTIGALKNDLKKVEKAIDALITGDLVLSRLRAILLSVPGIGRITMIQILISTNEFKSITCPKKLACYAGVAPFKNESGTFAGRARISRFANRRLKSLLHICAMNARKAEPELKVYFERKTAAEGKPKLAVINAIRAKLIQRVYACVRQNRFYEKRHIENNKQQPDQYTT